MSSGATVAAIACGTNSTRLLVVDAKGRPLDRQIRITRLGDGVDAARRLKPEAIERTVAALREYRCAMDALGVERVRLTATSAVRDAANRETFLSAAEEVVGFRPELLTGDAEARLSFRSALAKLDPTGGPFLVVDIGGGSTEFAIGPAVGRTGEPEGVVSVDMGCVRLTERFLHRHPPDPMALSQALSVVRDHLERVSQDLPATANAAQLVILAGTVTAVAAVQQRLVRDDLYGVEQYVLSQDSVEDLLRTLATETQANRKCSSSLEEALADVFVGGTLILLAIMRYFGHETCIVSDADILDGLVLSPSNREPKALYYGNVWLR